MDAGEVDATQPADARSRLLSYGLYGLAAVFLAFVVWRSEIWNAGDTLEGVRPEIIALVPLLSLAIALPIALRERQVLGGIGRRLTAWALGPISYYGNTVGFMTPAASGELLRPSLFQRVFGIPLAQGAGIVLYERAFSFMLFGLSSAFALAWTEVAPSWVGFASLPLLAATFVLPGIVAGRLPALGRLVNVGSLGRFVPGAIHRRFAGSVRESGATMRELWGSPMLTAQFAALTYITFAIMAFQFWLLIEGVGGQGLSLQEAWVVMSVGAMAGMLSGLPLGLGATDAVMLALLRAYDVEATTAGTIVILTRLLINLPTGILGSLAYLATLRQGRAGGGSPPEAPPARLAVAAGDNDS
jgi:uncharacterized protein (TIRG00374 family)